MSARALFIVVGFEHFSTHGDPQALEKLAAQHEKNQQRQRERARLGDQPLMRHSPKPYFSFLGSDASGQGAGADRVRLVHQVLAFA